MTEHLGLLKAVYDHWDSAAPKRIYADWLETQGHSIRAEYIRVHCDLACHDPWADAAIWEALKERQWSLEQNHQLELWGPLKDVVTKSSTGGGRLTFEQGFLTGFTGSARCLIGIADELTLNLPCLPSAQILATFDDEITELGRCSLVGRVLALCLRRGHNSDLDLTALLETPFAAGVQELTLSDARLAAQFCMQRRAASPWLVQLRSLAVVSVPLTDVAIREFSKHARLPDLNRLVLHDVGLTVPSLRMLCQASFAAQVRQLDLSIQHDAMVWPGEVFASLAALPLFNGLEELSISGRSLRQAGLTWLAGAAARNLHSLDLADAELADTDVLGLCSNPELKRLQELRLDGNSLTALAGRSITTAAFAQSLRRLSLRYTGTMVHGLDFSQDFDALETLDISHNNLGEDLAEGLLSYQRLCASKRIYIHGCGLSPASVQQLMKRWGGRVLAVPQER